MAAAWTPTSACAQTWARTALSTRRLAAPSSSTTTTINTAAASSRSPHEPAAAAAAARPVIQRANASTLARVPGAETQQHGQPRKRRIVVLGSGWGGYSLCRELDKTKYDVVLVSPSTNFAFTPLLAGVCAGALDYRSAIEPVREIKGITFLHSWADAVDVRQRTVTLVPAYPRALNEDRFAETRGGFNTAFVRPAHRRPVETAERDASKFVNGNNGTTSSMTPAGAPSGGAPGSGAFSPSLPTSAQPVSSSALFPAPTEGGAPSSPSTSSSSGGGGGGTHTATAGQLAGHISYGPSETWASQERGCEFKIGYDALVVAVGSFNRTFKLKGVKSNAWFLKDIQNARAIRFRLFECLEQASALHLNDEERSRLLQWVIVGGGPTGSELAAELVDLREDIKVLYPRLAPLIKITLLDSAPGILNTFHDRLASYARAKFARDGIDMRLGRTVLEVKKGRIVVEGDGEIPFSLLVWSTGICANPLIKKLAGASARPERNGLGAEAEEQGWGSMSAHERTAQLMIDDHLRVLAPPSAQAAASASSGKDKDKELQSAEEVELGTHAASHGAGQDVGQPQVLEGVFAIGDSAALQSGMLPATAQVAAQQAKHLAKLLNDLPPPSSADVGSDANLSAIAQGSPFRLQNRGIMASLGAGRAIVQLPPMPANSKTERDLSGRPAWLAWRSAYSMMSLS